ncbi:hypothetical protein E3U23_11115 [Erythrobacter litoralis]|uniref:hypothetical protein n=1 Tax=Erythrobacter litoralis TaxID=39960 RepID=UPI00243574BC|nr:hypothetical protein [Erythrobacter litoralis]MDG6079738.1 hypothetical protein [Erythrobacter litoralis]
MPPWTTARIALKGVWLAAIGAAVLVLAIFASIQSVRLNGFHLGPISIAGWIAKAGEYEAQRDSERLAHSTTKQTYRLAQEEAARLERERLERVTAEQEKISDAIENDYRARLAIVRDRADRLRQELSAGTGTEREAAGDSVPGLSHAAAGSNETASDPRLPATGRTTNQLERDLIATEQAIQLDALIGWVEAQAKVDPAAGASD